MHVEIPHQFSRKEAVIRVTDALQKSRAQVLVHAPDFAADWRDHVLEFSATIQDKAVSGTLEVQDAQFILDAKLPLLWRMFEGRIEKAIKEQVAGMR